MTRSGLLAGLLAILLCALPVPAGGLEYTRPSRGAAFTPMNAVTATTTSAAYDWSAFTGATIRLTSTGAGVCSGTLATRGSTTVNGTYATVADPNGTITFGALATTGSLYVPAAMPFVRWVFTATACPDTLTVTIVPEPYALTVGVQGSAWQGMTLDAVTSHRPVIVGGGLNSAPATVQVAYADSTGHLFTTTASMNMTTVNSDTVVAVTNAAGGTVVAVALGATIASHRTVIQNVGTSAMACSLGGVPVIGTTGIILAPGTAANDGLGASVVYENYTGTITCRAAGVGGSVAVQRW